MQVRSLAYSILADGRHVTRPYLSPNGEAVAWTQDAGGQQDVFVASQGQVRQLTNTPENEGFALVSDNGQTVAFTRRSAEINIWQLHLQRDSATGLLEDGGHHVQSAALSADGSRIAWENYGRVDQADTSAVLLSPQQHLPQHGDHEARQLKPSLSGDGRTLVYQVSDLDSAESHLVVESGGAEIAEIDNNTDAPVALSFDGSAIVYPTTDDQGFHDLSMWNRQTGASVVISAEPGADETQPSVASNGDVAFTLVRYDDKAVATRSIMRKSEHGMEQLVAADDLWEPSLPQLSADGRTLLWLATSKADPDHHQIRVAQL